MWTSIPFTVALASLLLTGVRCIGETFGADMMAAVRPIPEAYDVGNPLRSNGTVIRDTECKNCPYSTCVNYGIMPAGLTAAFQCFTQGETVGNSKTWVRYAFAPGQDGFCYITTFDMEQGKGDFTVDLPYCGTKSELSFYLPTQKVKTIYYTECSLCPWRDCEGIKFYQSGATLDVNCQVTDGWNQLGPLHPDGTRKYYRTADNCYVSVNTVEDLAMRVPQSSATMTRPANLMQEPLPFCGPVPHLRATNRPGLLEEYTKLPIDAPSVPAALPLQTTPKPDAGRAPPPKPPSVQPKSTSAMIPDDEEEEEDDDSPLKLRARTVRITRAPAAPCRTCPKSSCKAAQRFAQRQKAKVQCSTTNQFLRTPTACYLHGKDTDLSKEDAKKLPACSVSAT